MASAPEWDGGLDGSPMSGLDEFELIDDDPLFIQEIFSLQEEVGFDATALSPCGAGTLEFEGSDGMDLFLFEEIGSAVTGEEPEACVVIPCVLESAGEDDSLTDASEVHDGMLSPGEGGAAVASRASSVALACRLEEGGGLGQAEMDMDRPSPRPNVRRKEGRGQTREEEAWLEKRSSGSTGAGVGDWLRRIGSPECRVSRPEHCRRGGGRGKLGCHGGGGGDVKRRRIERVADDITNVGSKRLGCIEKRRISEPAHRKNLFHVAKENLAEWCGGMKHDVVVDLTDKFVLPAPKSAKPGAKCVEESDPHRLQQRQKQIDYGKNTLGYERYLEQVPKPARRKTDPATPNIRQICSKRSWDGQIRKWRRLLHEFDLPVQEEEELAEEFC